LTPNSWNGTGRSGCGDWVGGAIVCCRAKDFARILGLLESGSVTREQVARLAARHGLADAWTRFEARFLSPEL